VAPGGRALAALDRALAPFIQKLQDTLMAARAEAYAAALAVYYHAKVSGRGAGLESLVDDLARRFVRRAGKKDEEPTTPTTAPTTSPTTPATNPTTAP
jgi:hypothetical protein